MPIFFLCFALLLALPVLWPQIDIYVSSLFYSVDKGFFLSNLSVFEALHVLANTGARVLGVLFIIFGLISWYRHKKVFIEAKAWLFLLLALLVGPGLMANVVFKDHWGRSRPREIVEFGGEGTFSPALVPHLEKARPNGSFVCGDGAFGFFLPAFAYVIPQKKKRRVFWAGTVAGGVFSFVRLAVGAHFLSDILFAALLIYVVTAALHAVMFGAGETRKNWKEFFIPRTGP